MLNLFVEGEPIPQPRPRVVTVRGRGMAISNPKKHPVTAFKAQIQSQARVAMKGRPPLAGGVEGLLVFLMPRPGRLRWKTRPMPRCVCPTRPDIENLAKSVFDALTGIVWVDDSQVVSVHLQKLYAAGDEQPGVGISLWPTKTEDLPHA